MTLAKLKELCQQNNIPDDVELLSDSGWECSETNMDGVWYSKEANCIVFTQGEEVDFLLENDRKYYFEDKRREDGSEYEDFVLLH
jgi:hypothetical protein